MNAQKNKIVRMKDIASRLGLSVPTISTVLNDKESDFVSESTRALVKKTALEMGYVKNHLIRAMHGLPTKTVGIVASLFYNPVNSLFIRHITKKLSDRKYFTLLADTNGDNEMEKLFALEMISRGADGLIIQTSYPEEEIQSVIAGRIPYVIFNSGQSKSNISVDLGKGGFLAAEHLLDHGHRKTAFFATHLQRANMLKLQGFKSAVESHGLSMDGLIFVTGAGSEDFAGPCSDALSKGATAFFAVTDKIAAILIRELGKIGKSVPKDVAVIGFDGLESREFVTPILTTIRQPVERVAQKAVERMLNKLIGGQSDDEAILIEPELVIGESCGSGPHSPASHFEHRIVHRAAPTGE